MTLLPQKKPNGYREPKIDKARPLTVEFIRNKNFINKQKTIAEFSAMFDCDLNHAADLFDHLVLCDYLRKGKKNKNQFIVNQRALKKQFQPDNQQKESQYAQLAHSLITADQKRIELKEVRLQCIEYVKARRFISSRKLLAVFDDMFNDDHVAYGAIEFLKAVGFIELSTAKRGYFYVNHNAIHKSHYKKLKIPPRPLMLSDVATCLSKLNSPTPSATITLLLMHEYGIKQYQAQLSIREMSSQNLILKNRISGLYGVNHDVTKNLIDNVAKPPPPPAPGVRYVKDAATLPKSVMGDIIKYSVLKKEKYMWRLVIGAVVASFIAGGLVGVLV